MGLYNPRQNISPGGDSGEGVVSPSFPLHLSHRFPETHLFLPPGLIFHGAFTKSGVPEGNTRGQKHSTLCWYIKTLQIGELIKNYFFYTNQRNTILNIWTFLYSSLLVCPKASGLKFLGDLLLILEYNSKLSTWAIAPGWCEVSLALSMPDQSYLHSGHSDYCPFPTCAILSVLRAFQILQIFSHCPFSKP